MLSGSLLSPSHLNFNFKMLSSILARFQGQVNQPGLGAADSPIK